jgi:hypothetical protein
VKNEKQDRRKLCKDATVSKILLIERHLYLSSRKMRDVGPYLEQIVKCRNYISSPFYRENSLPG